MLYKSGINLTAKLQEFIKGATDLSIFVPYIKLATLKELLLDTPLCKAVVVRWEPRDLLLGSSDLEVYLFCKENNITLYRNKRIHLKAFVNNYKQCIMGSANISSRALNIPEYVNYNYELFAFVDNLSLKDRLYFTQIMQESTLINDSIYEQIKAQLLINKIDVPDETDFNFNLFDEQKDFLISALPLSYDVQTLLNIYHSNSAETDEKLNCAIHDLALYNLPLGISDHLLKEKLKEAFFRHPFIKAFLENLEQDGEIYFGAAKEWIHKNCVDVPLPRKWEITENIQILYRWIIDLGEGRFSVDRPNYSERLFVSGGKKYIMFK